MKKPVQNRRIATTSRSVLAPSAICALLKRMVGDLRVFTRGPSGDRSFCSLSRKGELAVLSINPSLQDGMRVFLQRWDWQRSEYEDRFVCYVITTKQKGLEIFGADLEPASVALQKKLRRALNIAARQFEGGILAG